VEGGGPSLIAAAGSRICSTALGRRPDIVVGEAETLTVPEATAQLRRLYESQRRYRFIEQAHRVLSVTQTASELSRLTFRALAELGLGGPARELLQLRHDLSTNEQERAELQSSVAGWPNGRIGWAQCEDTFGRNVTALIGHRPGLGEWADSARDLLSRIHLYRSLQGQYFISRRQPGKLREWLADLTTLEEEADIRLAPRGQLGPAVIVGARFGAVMERVYEDTHRLFLSYSHPLYLIEPDPVRFAAWLHCADHTRLLGDERVYVFVGDGAADQLGRLLTENHRLGLPAVLVNLCPETTTVARVGQTVESAAARRTVESEQILKALEERYRDRDAAYWAERFKPPGPILGLTSRFTTMLQYSIRDTMSALEAQGYETEILLESADHEVVPPMETCRRILELDPLMVLCLDHLRYEYPHIPRNLPFLCWIQDPMPKLLCHQAGASIGPFDFVCGYFHRRCVREFGYPAERFEFTNVPVSARIFHDGELDEESRLRYAADICFVSNASTPIEQFYQSAAEGYPRQLRPLLAAIYERTLRVLEENRYLDFQMTASDFVRSIAEEVGIHLDASQFEQIDTHFAYRLFDWGRRQQTLEWVAAWARRTGRVLKLYGQGWENHPTLGEFAAGVIEHGEPLRRACRASKLALQLIPSGFRHQRALETLACGALPLTRYCPVDFDNLPIETYVTQREAGLRPDGIATIFPGLERVVFRTPEEFEELAERYLTDEARRLQVLNDLRQVVLRDYTYDAVVRRVLKPFGAQIMQRASRQTAESPA